MGKKATRRVVRLKDAPAECGVSKATFYRWGQKGLLPARIEVDGMPVGYFDDVLHDWLADHHVKGDPAT